MILGSILRKYGGGENACHVDFDSTQRKSGIKIQKGNLRNMKLKVVLDPGAIMPTRAHPEDAGLDLFSREDVEIGSGESHTFDTGVHVEIPVGYVGMIKSKRGLNVKHGITSEGVIDAGYTGSIAAKLYNHGRFPVYIQTGQKISQLVIMPIVTPDLELVDSLEETERGNGGFGSTGRF